MSDDPNEGRDGYVENMGQWVTYDEQITRRGFYECELKRLQDASQTQDTTAALPSLHPGNSTPVGKGVPLWVSIPIWAGLAWAFTHFPFMTQGHWSGPVDFGCITMALLITSPRLRGLGVGCLLPLPLMGTLLIYSASNYGSYMVHRTPISYRKQADIALPEDPQVLLNWLEEQKKRQHDLQKTITCFLETGDVKLLDAFVTDITTPAVGLKEPISKPVALFDYEGLLDAGKKHNFPAEEMLKQQQEDIKRFFPNIEIETVETKEGKKLLAFIGVEPKYVRAAGNLCMEERSIGKNIERGNASLGIDKNTFRHSEDYPVQDVSDGHKVAPLPTTPKM